MHINYYRFKGIPTPNLDEDPPSDPSIAVAYWCDMDYFIDHTGRGEHPPCRCPHGLGHNDLDQRRFRTQRIVYGKDTFNY